MATKDEYGFICSLCGEIWRGHTLREPCPKCTYCMRGTKLPSLESYQRTCESCGATWALNTECPTCKALEKPKTGYMQWYRCYNCGYTWASNQGDATCLMCGFLGRKVTWQEKPMYRLRCTCGHEWVAYALNDPCKKCNGVGEVSEIPVQHQDGPTYTHYCTKCENTWDSSKSADHDCPWCAVVSTPLERQEGGQHYKDMKIQPVEFIHANNIPFIEGCCIKYLCRWRKKGGAEDLKKVIHFVELLIELETRHGQS